MEDAICVNVWTNLWRSDMSAAATSWWENLPRQKTNLEPANSNRAQDWQRRECLLDKIRKVESILLESGMLMSDVLRVVATAIEFSHQCYDKLKSLGAPDENAWVSWSAYVTVQASLKFHARASSGADGGICQRYIFHVLQSNLGIQCEQGRNKLERLADAIFLNQQPEA